jgi:hypothetical protein
MEKSKDNNQYSELLYNLVITIGIVLLLCLGSYAVYSIVYPQSSISTIKSEQNTQEVPQESVQETSSVMPSNSSQDTHSESSYKVSPVSEQVNSYPIGNPSTPSIAVVQECVQSAPIQPATKQQYNKLDEITLPSSISNSTGGYIGRDFVCFRSKLGNEAYVSKNTGCMACQVDKSGKNNNYGGTLTNVISTCVYTDDPNNTDPNIWSKQMCISACEKLKDVN